MTTFGPGPNRADSRSLRAALDLRAFKGGLRVGWPLMFLTKGGLAFAKGGLKVGRVLRRFLPGGLASVIGRKEGGLGTAHYRTNPPALSSDNKFVCIFSYRT